MDPGLGGLGDERRRHPGRAGDRHGPAAATPARGARRRRRRRRSRCCPCWSPGATHGGSRLDRNLDGKIDDPGAAIMDAAWPKIADAFMKPQLGSAARRAELAVHALRASPPAGQYDGWYQYFDRDIRTCWASPSPQPFQNSYCGHGDKSACQQAVWDAIAAAGAELTAASGDAQPGGLARGRDRRADPLRPGPAADHDALHQPPERDPAGDLVQRSSLSPAGRQRSGSPG